MQENVEAHPLPPDVAPLLLVPTVIVIYWPAGTLDEAVALAEDPLATEAVEIDEPTVVPLTANRVKLWVLPELVPDGHAGLTCRGERRRTGSG